ncbi:MAG: hypothetical protein NEA02_18390 [Thermoanaerobaculia bacterium]|nr:hypothetical protein [Thermoanaerobaculia bacterium]
MTADSLPMDRPTITFLTLLLGLTTGVWPIEIAVGPGVAAVELRLDGRTVATLTQAPWKASIDLGPEPEPHELLAIGRDAAGAEIARARQMVNMPRPPAEASLVLLPGSGGRGRRARLTWQNTLRMPPERIAVTFDGQPVPLEPTKEIALPEYVPEQVHFLRVELDFPDNLVASTELIFGGRDRDEARAELTGIPALFAGTSRTAADLDGAFLAGGNPVRVSAVEEGPGEIVVVRDEEARAPLGGLKSGSLVNRIFERDLRPDQKIRFCWPVTLPEGEASESYDVFLRSGDLVGKSGGLQRLLTVPNAPAFANRPRFADAIAVAARSAAGRNRARAVLFLYGGSPDSSRLAPEVVRRYQAKLRVPLYVWAVDAPSARKAARWGKVSPVRNYPEFLAAAGTLLDEVAAQRIVWVEGVHLPQSITVSPGASGIRVAE